ncbi:hypothetical protein CQW23_02157 [Capsicum baccatum]|uniref:Uncharacterized protein n=1 Tax=Capsicum baccatum TaxID=33114 RepID=A0A2G2XQM8_CAPBA|nr:hypothetical protein CQW23_02157 [Capsicum baccatum]
MKPWQTTIQTSCKHLRIGTCDTLKFELVANDTTGSCNTSLETLTIENCDSLPDIPLGNFPGLQVLSIINCKNLQTISIHCGVQTLNLQRHTIRNCDKFKLLPTQMTNVLQSLAFLDLDICQGIERFSEGGLPSSLQILYMIGREKLMTNQKGWGLQTLTRLRYCRIQNSDVESFPNDSIFPPSLEILTLGNHPNLWTLNYKGLQNLTSLRHLTIWNCPQLQSLPEEGLPSSLTALDINGCGLLNQRLESEKGEEWQKIRHIRCVSLDQRLIRGCD